MTEEITGLDLIELQIRSATGKPLAFEQSQVVLRGHAFEARINAEDPWAGFAPQTGTITHLLVPDSARWDSGVELGSEIGPHYDSMLAKLIVHGSDRHESLRLLRRALDGLVIGGIPTTAGFHRWLVDQPPVIDGRVTTRFLDESDMPTPPGSGGVASLAAHRWLKAKEALPGGSVWSDLGSFRTTPHRPTRCLFLRDGQGVVHDISGHEETGAVGHRPTVVDLENHSIAINDRGTTHTFDVISRSERWAPSSAMGHGRASAIVAPFPAIVVEVSVGPGDEVSGGDVLVVIEAMKMLHSLTAAGPGMVEEVRVAVGEQIDSNQVLVTFHTSDTEGAAAHTSDATSAAAHTSDATSAAAHTSDATSAAAHTSDATSAAAHTSDATSAAAHTSDATSAAAHTSDATSAAAHNAGDQL